MVGEDGPHICIRVCEDATPKQALSWCSLCSLLAGRPTPAVPYSPWDLGWCLLPHTAGPRAQPHPQQGLEVLAWPRDPTELTEKQLPLWAHSLGHENTLVTHPHSHQGSQGWEDTTDLPSTLSGLASPLMCLCPPSLRWMRRPTLRTSSTASPSASGSR